MKKATATVDTKNNASKNERRNIFTITPEEMKIVRGGLGQPRADALRHVEDGRTVSHLSLTSVREGHGHHRAVDVHGFDPTGLEEPTCELRGRVVGDDLVAGLVAHMTHSGEAAVEFEPHDARTGRRRLDEGDRLSHNDPKVSESVCARPTWPR